jgi:hypothetical protein
VADKGYDPKMGARPMARVIQEHIKRPLAEELLFGKLVNGGQVKVSVARDGSAQARLRACRGAAATHLLTRRLRLDRKARCRGGSRCAGPAPRSAYVAWNEKGAGSIPAPRTGSCR